MGSHCFPTSNRFQGPSSYLNPPNLQRVLYCNFIFHHAEINSLYERCCQLHTCRFVSSRQPIRKRGDLGRKRKERRKEEGEQTGAQGREVQNNQLVAWIIKLQCIPIVVVTLTIRLLILVYRDQAMLRAVHYDEDIAIAKALIPNLQANVGGASSYLSGDHHPPLNWMPLREQLLGCGTVPLTRSIGSL